MKKAVLVLADGEVFHGNSFGATGEVVGEVVFNTSMFGYQELITHPSLAGQILVFSYPHIGSVGVNAENVESDRPHAIGLALSELTQPSNWQAKESLESYIERWGIAGVCDLDTRRLLSHLRRHGCQPGVLSSETMSTRALIDRARWTKPYEDVDLVATVTTKSVYSYPTQAQSQGSWHVVVIDFGVSRSALNTLVALGAKVSVVPAGTSAEAILEMKPQAIFLSNGPGSPNAVEGASQTVAALVGKVPLAGIGLGYQMLALAVGLKVVKMKMGHRGGNQAVRFLETGRIEITGQHHGFVVENPKVNKEVEVSYCNVNDGSVEGIQLPGLKAAGIQFQPSGAAHLHPFYQRFARWADSSII
ncbi:MAG: glutamine-hydrolyzing carbamoyl-phosphate synthase small subunit [Proteobacteria bacterium]|nr:glutamine-hydrolyzing carbamoyl-phosphate synthase small subunit [Cystobacterineae bacterium]MCL2258643.1 glutamine-hydrolyzing carbamoyl-phosphate synthase small subunit [Cystobacterineae bacterium]MCL2314942.1 glutamine-hydrolyzing carbamoyl-phosphate synthase small subunit [Pseudomonadota bacterium]